MKEYEQLNITDREKIAILKAKGLSNRDIGKAIGRAHTTISREINNMQEYTPSVAQAMYGEYRKSTGRKSLFEEDKEVRDYAEFKLSVDRWLPDEVANRCKLEEDQGKYWVTL